MNETAIAQAQAQAARAIHQTNAVRVPGEANATREETGENLACDDQPLSWRE
jgi:hypothetical protein